MAPEEFGFVFPSVDVTDGTRAVDDEYLFGPGGEMGLACGKGPIGINLRPNRVSQQMLVGKQTGQGHAPEGGSRTTQEIAPVEERGSGWRQVFGVHGCVSVMEDSENTD